MILAHAIEAARQEPQASVIRNSTWPTDVVIRVDEDGTACKCLHSIVRDGETLKNVFAPLSLELTISAAISDNWQVAKL